MPRVTRWYRSFYWRIAATFVGLVVLVLLAQGALATYLTQRPSDRAPNNLAATVAMDVARRLAADAATDLNPHLKTAYRDAEPLYVVLKGGRIASNVDAPLDAATRRSIEALLDGVLPAADAAGPQMPTPLNVTAPIQATTNCAAWSSSLPRQGAAPLRATFSASCRSKAPPF